MHHRHALSAIAMAVLTTLPVHSAENAIDDDQKDAEVIITLGTRVSGRTATESAAPVDIISSEAIRNAGISDTGELLRALAPSFNMNNTTTSDGQDLMRPATLRSMGPDQVLVLVNGKRRHQQAIVAVQQNVGRGNAGTDFNAIPITAIDRVEVLRDGAAAQYGSDAIAGVINIILKDDEGTRGFVQYGRTAEGDGVNKHVGVNSGFVVGNGGIVNVSVEWQDKGEINRAAETTWFNSTTPKRQLLLVGEAAVTARQLWLNSNIPLAGGELYFFGGKSTREAESLGFFRPPHSERVWDQLYPNGVTPKLGTRSEDTSYAFGYKNSLGNTAWDFDTSYTHGENRFEFRNLQSLNASYGPDSPTSAYDGALIFSQDTFNADFSGAIAWGIGDSDLSLAFGLEHRTDGYELEAGELVSYARGDTLCNQLVNPTGNPSATCAPSAYTTPGMQGFQGYRPEHEIDTDRDSTAFYADSEAYFTSWFSLGAAVRFEDYSDFGKTTTGKLSARFELNEANAIRFTYSTGFRAPGVQQQFFTQRSISIDANGVLQDLITLRPGSTLATELGFEDLKEETSTGFSIGFVHDGEIWTSTLDIYRINLDDRIIYSQGLSANSSTIDLTTNGQTGTGPNGVADIREFFTRHRVPGGQLDGVAAIEIFTNAADTETRGLDWVNTWRVEEWTYEASMHFNDTKITSRHTSSPIVPINAIIDPGIENLLEDAQPGRRATLSANWHTGPNSLTLRASYYGEYSDYPAAYGLGKHTWSAKTLFDLVGYHDVDEYLRIAGGILNVADTYPDKWGTDGAPFSDQIGFTYGWNTVPFGLAGRQYYVRAEFTF